MKTTKASIHDRLTAAILMLIDAAHTLTEVGVDMNKVCDVIEELQQDHDHVPGWKCDSCPVRDFANRG